MLTSQVTHSGLDAMVTRFLDAYETFARLPVEVGVRGAAASCTHALTPRLRGRGIALPVHVYAASALECSKLS